MERVRSKVAQSIVIAVVLLICTAVGVWAVTVGSTPSEPTGDIPAAGASTKANAKTPTKGSHTRGEADRGRPSADIARAAEPARNRLAGTPVTPATPRQENPGKVVQPAMARPTVAPTWGGVPETPSGGTGPTSPAAMRVPQEDPGTPGRIQSMGGSAGGLAPPGVPVAGHSGGWSGSHPAPGAAAVAQSGHGGPGEDTARGLGLGAAAQLPLAMGLGGWGMGADPGVDDPGDTQHTTYSEEAAEPGATTTAAHGENADDLANQEEPATDDPPTEVEETAAPEEPVETEETAGPEEPVETEAEEVEENEMPDAEDKPEAFHIIADLAEGPVVIDPFGGAMGCEGLKTIPLLSGFVSAKGQKETVRISQPGHYVLKISGTFMFSSDGFQDGTRRWHFPYRPNDAYPDTLFSEPFCVSCEVDASENLISLLINNKTRRSLQECPFENVYFHHLYVDKAQDIELVIKDLKSKGDAYEDNKGQLTWALFPIPFDHWILQRDSGNRRLGVEVGALVGQGVLKILDPTLDVLGGVFQKLIQNFSLSEPKQDVLIEVYGIVALSPGYEMDYRSRWNYYTTTREPLDFQPVTFNCATTEVIAEDIWAHRHILKATDCPADMTAVVSIPEDQTHPKTAGSFEVKVYGMPQ